MQDFSAGPREMVASFWRNRLLIYTLSKREVLIRYKGSYLGVMWSFFNPLFMLAVYTFVFGQIFKSHWSAESNSKAEFALVLFAGLLIFNIFSECLNQAPKLILSNANYVKKVVFPLEILPWVNLYSALFHGLVSLIVWLLAYVVLFGAPHVTMFLLPFIVLPFCLIVMGLSWVLASLGVYLRDIGQFISILITALMFLSPVFYPISFIPEQFQKLMLLNPITIPVQVTRDFLFWGIGPEMNLECLVLYWGVSLLIAAIGFFWFQKTRKGFADVL